MMLETFNSNEVKNVRLLQVDKKSVVITIETEKESYECIHATKNVANKLLMDVNWEKEGQIYAIEDRLWESSHWKWLNAFSRF